MKRAVVVLLLLIANAIFVSNKNRPTAPAPVELLRQGRQTRNAAEDAATKKAREESLRDNDPIPDSAAEVAEGLAAIDRALIQDPAEYIGGDRL
jgi:hypothetical protein